MINAKAREASKAEGCPVRAFVEPQYNAAGTMVSGSEAGFGWEGATVDRAIHADNVVALKWTIEYGLIDKTTKTFYNTTIRKLCIEKGAKKCEKHLESLGYPA